MNTEYFECQCHSDEHAVRFMLDADDDPATLYLGVYMDNRRGLWRRAWLALKYTFGYQCQYGAFGNWILRPEDAGRLRALIDKAFPVQQSPEPK